jgi:hypothetical protein
MVFVQNGNQFGEPDFYESGSLRDGTLLHDAVVNGFACAGGFDVAFYESGALSMERLARDARIAGVPCNADHYTFFHANGAPSNTTLSSQYESGARQYEAGMRVTLDECGNVIEWRSRASEDEFVQGVPCLGAVPVWYYGDGRLSVAHLSQPWTIEGEEYPAWTEVMFGQDGRLAAAHVLDEHPSRFKERVYGAIDL